MSSLVVNTNLSAINAYSNLNATDQAMTKAIQELSSGLQIQTAADNPSGYVTSQALESQSNGYQAAISNAQNGVSLIQTASGALNQISSLLQTMNQLALNSANQATNDPTSLNANQQEFAALQSEIQQISQTTSFGTTPLLDGSFSNQVLQVGAFDNVNQIVTLNVSAADINALGVGTTAVGAQVVGAPLSSSVAATTVTIVGSVDGTAATLAVTITAASTPGQVLSDVQAAITAATLSGSLTVSLNANGELVFSTITTGNSQTLQVTGGSNLSELGLATTSVQYGNSQGVSVETYQNAQGAVSAVQNAIANVASIEANVGATQNQLQAVVANLTVGQQNLQAAYSGLVDVNFAQATTTFTTDQILMQSGVAMLSQAQQTPSMVLKLLG